MKNLTLGIKEQSESYVSFQGIGRCNSDTIRENNLLIILLIVEDTESFPIIREYVPTNLLEAFCISEE